MVCLMKKRMLLKTLAKPKAVLSYRKVLEKLPGGL